MFRIRVYCTAVLINGVYAIICTLYSFLYSCTSKNYHIIVLVSLSLSLNSVLHRLVLYFTVYFALLYRVGKCFLYLLNFTELFCVL